MANEEDNSSAQVVEEQQQPQPSATPDESNKPEISAAEQARRQQQSEADKGKKVESDDFVSRVEFLEQREMERVRDQHVSGFLRDNASDYPNVKADDPLFKYANSEDDVKDIAAEIQNRYKTMQQEALSSVQTEPDWLTEEEIAEEEKKLEEDTTKHGRSNFMGFLNTQQRRKR